MSRRTETSQVLTSPPMMTCVAQDANANSIGALAGNDGYGLIGDARQCAGHKKSMATELMNDTHDLSSFPAARRRTQHRAKR